MFAWHTVYWHARWLESSFFYSLNNLMAGTDQYYMHLMYLGNIDVVSAQMSKVHEGVMVDEW